MCIICVCLKTEVSHYSNINMQWAVLLTLSAAVLVTYVQSYSVGPPVVAHPELCDDMFPSGHSAAEQTIPSPHKIVFNTNNCYSTAALPITGWYQTIY